MLKLKLKLDTGYCRCLRGHFIRADITMWIIDDYKKSSEIWNQIHKCLLKLLCYKEALYLSLLSGSDNFSGLADIWDGPSHRGNTHFD